MKLKFAHSHLNLRIVSSTSVPFTHTTVQGPYLALVETKRITVYIIETAYASVGALFYAQSQRQSLFWIQT